MRQIYRSPTGGMQDIFAEDAGKIRLEVHSVFFAEFVGPLRPPPLIFFNSSAVMPLGRRPASCLFAWLAAIKNAFSVTRYLSSLVPHKPLPLR
ncbi:hypothetical protein Q5H92_19055 [Hymenobacter sp. M29]|uniref:Uncharacterized protein n=1 Tax=Hymenobacter mellowenesis TaxID=3063995 RepID=A0ABT9AF33_9BACT|nr:hypothetical protein [Hymenobacter sp. M29]MDO7848473.1 hypothetical protein [Hymenobacter sp. M29]